MVKRDGIQICLAVACGILGSLRTPSAAAETRIELTGGGGSAAERSLVEAAHRAEEKLATASCRMIFQDFRSLNGRLLQETLDEQRQTGQTYFESLEFYDGHGRPKCDTRDILAFTLTGSRAVFVCSVQFVERAHQDPGLAAVLLIHEELHALGLGENPPSSRAITQKVIERCGK